MTDCPMCGAPQGQRCLTKSGKRRGRPHTARTTTQENTMTSELLESTEREPTPAPRTWALPEEPPVGTRLIGSDDDAWERDRDGWRWFSLVQRKWIETDEWIDILLANGPLREATPDDLARLGIEDPS